MARITLRQLLDHAAEHQYGCPAFNVNNMEQMQAIMQAADETDSPVIVSILNSQTIDNVQACNLSEGLKFQPGLVGGHCIGVDPYYLTHKAQEVGYHPNMILAGRRLNDNMGQYIGSRVIKLMIKGGIDVSKAKILIMGLTFKENCPDLRNTKVVDIIAELKEYGIEIVVHDPWVDKDEAMKEYGLKVASSLGEEKYDGVVLAVAHRQFVAMEIQSIRDLCHEKHVIFDVKNIFPTHFTDGRL